RAAHHFLCRPAKQFFCRAIPSGHANALVDHDDRLRSRVDEGLKHFARRSRPRLRRSEFALCGESLGDVSRDNEPKSSAIKRQRTPARLDVDFALILSTMASDMNALRVVVDLAHCGRE